MLMQRSLNTPRWPLPDLISRGHNSTNFRATFANWDCSGFQLPLCFFWHTLTGQEVLYATHSSLHQLVLQREFHSTCPSMLNLSDFIVLVIFHVLVTVHDFRALIVNNCQCSWGVFPFASSKFRINLIRSHVCLIVGTRHLVDVKVSANHVVLYPQQPSVQMSDFAECHSACNCSPWSLYGT